MILFLIVRTLVLRSQNSYERAFYVYPILMFVTTFVLSLFIIFKGAKGKDVADKLGDTEAEQDGYVVFVEALARGILFECILKQRRSNTGTQPSSPRSSRL